MVIASRNVLNLALGLAGVLLGVATPVRAQNWDWSYQFTTTAHVDAHPVAISQPDASGFWAIGSDAFLHYTAGDTLDHASGNREASMFSGGRIGALAGGGIVLVGQPFYTGNENYTFCTISEYAADGVSPWQQIVYAGYEGCDLGVDGRNGIWVLRRGGDDLFFRYSADGVESDVGVNATIADFAVNPQADGGVYVAAAGSPATILALDQHGTVRWSWTDPTNADTFAAITLGGDGNLYAATRSQGSVAGALSIISLTRDGALRFAHAASDVQISNIVGKAVGNDGNLYFVDNIVDSQNQPTQLALQRIGADGGVRWNRVLADATHCPGPPDDYCAVSATPEGDVLLVVAGTSGPQLLRYDSDGNLLFSRTLAQSYSGAVVALANGDALLTQGTDDERTYSFLELDRSGNVRTAPATTQVLGGSTGGGASTFADDGTAYVSVDAPNGPELAKISPTGQLVWHVALDFGVGPLSAAGNRVCGEQNRFVRQFYYDVLLACFSTETGEQIWSTILDTEYFGYGGWPLQALDDGSIVILHRQQNGGGWEQLRFDANGALVHRTGLPAGQISSMTKSGLTVVLQDDKTRLLAYDANGTKVYDLTAPTQLANSSGFYTPIVEVLADGSVLVVFDTTDIEHATTVVNAWSVNPSGGTLWVKQISNGEADYAFTGGAPLAANGNFYFVFGKYDVYAPSMQARNARGDLLWENPNIPGNTLLHDPLTGNVVVVNQLSNRKLEMSALAPDSGAVRTTRYESCPVEIGAGNLVGGCEWNNVAIAADGSLHADADVINVAAPSTRQVFALKNAGGAPPQIRLDQPGLDGAWYAPYESGQGFTLDYIASAQTLFMPWFTYAPGNAAVYQSTPDPAGLAWYALYGTIAPGATSADLNIEAAEPGVLAAGIVGTHDVGTAHLSFSDCASGSLFYQFNADTNNGAGGLITLTRLSPSTSPCVLADGSTTPAQFANPAAQGFDARQSGSWFDPATSGQGMELTIIPANASYAGLVFAAWFTFDPAGAVDDAAHQHWFTLEGDLSAASGGTVSLQIMQTLGGTFDAIATQNTSLVGRATLTMQGCDRARLDYQFNDSDVAHAFAGIVGTTALVKIGGCAATP